MIVKILEVLFILTFGFTCFMVGFSFCKWGVDKGLKFNDYLHIKE